ncbi:hypothetical protein QBC32DRAFT_224248 [Pseudoneurospora amorphoporcata]|uniref:Uncharacterized protein n=1 Tax=Pseudoneurospora amorphoporcata TaxID=241081 RepID=A0AAN6NM73_9PEZI|nr:hypothetical protein QBC32DRAFT_224248 [Pseudoneurospora amorphoporcata]
MASTVKLSPIWRTLPFDLVLEILDHFTDNVIASCDISYIRDFDSDFHDQVYRHWQAFRQDSLFRSQRPRFERHF